MLIGLVTGLLGALFGVLAVSAEKLPAYLSLPLVRWAGVVAVILWLFSLLAALVVVLPRKWQSAPGLPQTQEQTLSDLLAHKTWWLTGSVCMFWLAVVMLGVVLVWPCSLSEAFDPSHFSILGSTLSPPKHTYITCSLGGTLCVLET